MLFIFTKFAKLFTKLFTGINIIINFKIINLKIKITFKKSLLANTNQKLQMQKCQKIIKQANE